MPAASSRQAAAEADGNQRCAACRTKPNTAKISSQAITIMAKLGGRSGTPVSSSNGSWNSRHGTMPK